MYEKPVVGVSIVKDYADTQCSQIWNIFTETKNLGKPFLPLYIRYRKSFFLFKKNCQQSLKGRCHKMLTPSSWFSPISAHSWSILHKVAMTWRYSQVMTQQSLYLTLQSPKCFLQFFQMFCSNLKRQFRNNVDALFHDLTSFRPKNQGLKHLTDQGFEIWRYFSKFV